MLVKKRNPRSNRFEGHFYHFPQNAHGAPEVLRKLMVKILSEVVGTSIFQTLRKRYLTIETLYSLCKSYRETQNTYWKMFCKGIQE